MWGGSDATELMHETMTLPYCRTVHVFAPASAKTPQNRPLLGHAMTLPVKHDCTKNNDASEHAIF